MIFLYGLGNNEGKYLNTKHNIGRAVLEWIGKEKNLNFKSKNRCYEAEFKTGDGESCEIKMLYSSDFMNTSGINLKEYLRYTNFKNEDILLVLQDDSDQVEGNLKLVGNSGAAGHKGINSIYAELAGFRSRILRLKIGIRPVHNKLKSETFVLSRMSKLDEKTIETLGRTILNSEFLEFLEIGKIDKATTLINSTKIKE